MDADKYDTEFLKGLGIERYETPALKPLPRTPREVKWPKEVAEIVGLSTDMLWEWERRGVVQLPRTELSQGDWVKILTEDQLAALREKKESFANATITQAELLEERELAKAAKESGSRWWQKKWGLAMRLSCGAKVQDGPLSAKFDGNGGLRVR